MPPRGVYKGGVSIEERVDRLTIPEPNSGYWLWLGAISPAGYGRINGRQAHVVSYEIHIGPIPQGLVLDHLCRTRCCVNPWHLEPVTDRENILRGTAPAALNAKKTHCKRGHPYDDQNTYWYCPGGRGQERHCKTCQRASARRTNERRRIERRRRKQEAVS